MTLIPDLLPSIFVFNITEKKRPQLLVTFSYQADNLALPFALLEANTFLPPGLLILARKPWTFDLCLFFGWKVIFIL